MTVWERWKPLVPDLGALGASVVAVLVALSPPKSFDLFFHLASGRDILAHGFPLRDPFSFTADRTHSLHEWLFGVIAEQSVRLLGAAGPEVLVALLVAATALWLWRALGAAGRRGLLAAVLFLLAMEALEPTWRQERPWHFGQPLFLGALLLLQRWRAGSPRSAWLFVPLTALWANLHASCLLGPVLLGLTAVGRLLDGLAAPAIAATRRDAALGLGLAAGSYLAMGLSAPGAALYLYPLQHAAGAPTARIMEWTALSFDLPFARAYFLLLALVLWLAGRSRNASLALLLPVAALVWSSVLIIRMVPFAALAVAAAGAELGGGVSLPELPAVLRRALEQIDRGLRAWSSRASGAALPFLGVVAVAAVAARHPADLLERLPRADYPVAALRALATLPPGRVFDRLRWGGAIAYFDGPEHPVFIDARNDLFPPGVQDAYWRIKHLEPGWRGDLASARPDYIVWGPVDGGTPLLEALETSADWQKVAADAAGSLWRRR
ncbi:MAG: hypothetical protein ACYDCL_03865 [Myxococcales bacterium]